MSYNEELPISPSVVASCNTWFYIIILIIIWCSLTARSYLGLITNDVIHFTGKIETNLGSISNLFTVDVNFELMQNRSYIKYSVGTKSIWRTRMLWGVNFLWYVFTMKKGFKSGILYSRESSDIEQQHHHHQQQNQQQQNVMSKSVPQISEKLSASKTIITFVRTCLHATFSTVLYCKKNHSKIRVKWKMLQKRFEYKVD